VFIGRDLPKEEIMAGIMQALPELSLAGFGSFTLSPVGQTKSPLLLPKPEFSQDLRVRVV
jgi:hypothetical protein